MQHNMIHWDAQLPLTPVAGQGTLVPNVSPIEEIVFNVLWFALIWQMECGPQVCFLICQIPYVG